MAQVRASIPVSALWHGVDDADDLGPDLEDLAATSTTSPAISTRLKLIGGGRVEALVRQMELDGLTPSERLNAAIHLFTERVNAQGLAIASGPTPTPARPPPWRGSTCSPAGRDRLYGQMGFPPAQVQARALLF